MARLKITEAEWAVMEPLWDSAPLTALEIVARLEPEQSWNPATVKTLLGRLVKKGALSYDKIGNRYSYSPAVSRDEAVTGEMDSFLTRVTKGSLFPLIAHSIQSKDNLDPEEIKELRRLLADHDEDSGV